MSSEYKRGWEDCLDVLYYRLRRKGIRDEKVFEEIRLIQGMVKEDKISRLMDELGLV